MFAGNFDRGPRMRPDSLLTAVLATTFAWTVSLAACSSGGNTADPGTADLAAGDSGDVAEVPAGDDGTGDEGTVLPQDVAVDTPPDVPPPVDPALRMRAAGWLSGDLHMHSNYQGGDDPVATVVALAEYLQSPEFLAFHPEYVGNPIDFIALTDHRMVTQNSDPDFHSDKVVLIPGDEFGSPGHAGLWGITTHVPHDPDGDGSTRDDYAAAVDGAHAQGALYSINHPCLPNIPFPWDVRTHDAMEVWNTRWGLQGTPVSADDLATWEAKNGAASPFFRRAVAVQDEGGSGQFLRFYEAQLSVGVHVALVGGSDRHLLFAEGFPSTWVQAATRDVAGILEGIRKRHTFVTRTPASATIEMRVDVAGNSFAMGDEVQVPAEGAEATVTLRVGRANKGRVRLIRGTQAADDAALATTALGVVAFEAAIDGIDFTTTTPLTVHPGDWFYPVVHEPLVPEGLDPALAASIPAKAATLSLYTEQDYSPVIDALLEYIDQNVVLAPEQCNPADWIATNAQCMAIDQNGMATFFFPDWIDRLLNVLTESGTASQWTMGAVGSAARCVPEPDAR